MTKTAREKFIKILGTTCNITVACREIGITRNTAYDHREKNAEFAAAWDNALEEAVDLLEAEARRDI